MFPVRDLNVLGQNKMSQSQRTVMKRILEAITWGKGEGERVIDEQGVVLN